MGGLFENMSFINQNDQRSLECPSHKRSLIKSPTNKKPKLLNLGLLKFGAGNEIRTRDPNLGNVSHQNYLR